MVLDKIYELGHCFDQELVVRGVVACYAKLSIDGVLALEMIGNGS